MITNEIVIQVDVPRQEAFDFLTDTSRWHEWMESVQAATLDGSFSVGSVVSVDYTEGVKAEMVLDAVEAPHSYAYTADSKDMTIRGEMSFADDAESTTIVYREVIDPKSFMIKVMKPFIAGSTKRALEKDFATAKKAMEDGR
jgi:uncharacterized protein YndB with AHSA1/START domain